MSCRTFRIVGAVGRDVLHCPHCHGYEVRDQPLGVLGGSVESVAHALLIALCSSDVVYFAHTSDLAKSSAYN